MTSYTITVSPERAERLRAAWLHADDERRRRLYHRPAGVPVYRASAQPAAELLDERRLDVTAALAASGVYL